MFTRAAGSFSVYMTTPTFRLASPSASTSESIDAVRSWIDGVLCSVECFRAMLCDVDALVIALRTVLKSD